MTWIDYLKMTSNDTDYHAFYLDGNQRTAVWTSSPEKNLGKNLAVPQSGTGSARDFKSNWGSHQKYKARPALYQEETPE